GLAHDLVAGGKVDQHRGAGQGLVATWRHGHPEVFADFDADRQPLDVGRGEEAVGPEGDGGAVDDDFAAARGGGAGEPSALVKLLVIGDERLGNQAKQPAAAKDGGAVEDLVVHGQRQADEGDAGVEVGAGLEDVFQ